MPKYLYRAEPIEARFRFVDFEENGPKWKLEVLAFPIIRETECFWFISHFGRIRKVGKKWIKQFASETPDLAILAFYKRKKKQITILQNQIALAREHQCASSDGYEVHTLPSYLPPTQGTPS